MPHLFKVRLAKPSDASYLPPIEVSAGEAFRTIEELSWIADAPVLTHIKHQYFIEQKNSWLVETAGGAFIGFLCAKPLGRYFHIAELSVDIEYQRQGIGKRLVAACIKHALKRGYEGVSLTTFRKVPWNKKLGFTVLDEEELTSELSALLGKEELSGLKRKDRCAMLLRL